MVAGRRDRHRFPVPGFDPVLPLPLLFLAVGRNEFAPPVDHQLRDAQIPETRPDAGRHGAEVFSAHEHSSEAADGREFIFSLIHPEVVLDFVIFGEEGFEFPEFVFEPAAERLSVGVRVEFPFKRVRVCAGRIEHRKEDFSSDQFRHLIRPDAGIAQGFRRDPDGRHELPEDRSIADRDGPDAEESEDMIDAEEVVIGFGVPEPFSPPPVFVPGEFIPSVSRKSPVLAVGVVIIGRASRGHGRIKKSRAGPDVRRVFI